MGVLTMNIYQQFTESGTIPKRCRTTVDIGSRSSLAGNDAPKKTIAVGIKVMLCQPVLGGGHAVNVETSADFCAVMAGANSAGVGAISQTQSQRVEHYGLAGAGFAGDHSKAIAEIDLEGIYDRKLTDSYLAEHGDPIPYTGGL
jgi:hypothetical protein